MSRRKDCPEWINELHYTLCHFNHPDMSAFNASREEDWDNENWDFWADCIEEDMENIYLGSELHNVYRSCGVSRVGLQVAL